VEKLIEKANVLTEVLPYIRRFYGKRIVVKFGGHAMIDEELKASFAGDIVLLKYIGLNPIVVHGGGPQIGEVLQKMGKESKFFRGMRVTDDETMDVVEMVLVGKVNKEIVGLINDHGGRAVGLSGKDGRLIQAKKIDINSLPGLDNPPEIIDIGKVGEVERIHPDVIKALEEDNFIPVIAPVGVGKRGENYNINADLVAGKVASSLLAEKLILLTDVEGVMDSDGRLISTLTLEEGREGIDNGEISKGMIPKVNCCIAAIQNGVSKAHIIDGRVKHAVLLEIFTDVGIGTEIVKEVEHQGR
jgi:acetylglutamate kinase